jgi:SAM-dependent methyltransferase
MLACPNCRHAVRLEALECASCGWRGEYRHGVPIVISDADRADPIFSSYLENYDCISRDDIAEPILQLDYVRYQANNLMSFLGRVDNLDVLDLGCGRGLLTKSLADKGAASITGVDVSLPYLSALCGISRIQPICANAENLPYDEQFDLAVSTDVLEHVLNVGSYLHSLNRALRPGGRTCIRVPLNENLLTYAAALGCKYRFVHLRSFNKSLIRDALEGAGFRVDRFRLDGFVPGVRRKFLRRPRYLYDRIEARVLRYVKDPISITSWPAAIAGMFWEPHEVIVMATKVKRIVAQSPQGFELANV